MTRTLSILWVAVLALSSRALHAQSDTEAEPAREAAVGTSHAPATTVNEDTRGVSTSEERTFRELAEMEAGEPSIVPETSPESSVGARSTTPPAAIEPLDVPRDPESGLYLLDVGFDLLPWMGTSTVMLGRDSRQLSLGLAGTLTGAVDGFEASAGLNITRFGVAGAQLAGGLNLVFGSVDGFQVAGGANLVTGSMDGFQAAGGANIVLASGGGFIAAGGANIIKGNTSGFVAAGGANIGLGEMDGLQLAGGLNLAREVRDGTQIAGGMNVALGDVRGVQLAPLNIAENADAAIGLLNIMYRGRWALDAWSGDTGLVTSGLVNGARYTHTILHFGVQPWGKRAVGAAGLGFGGHIPINDSWAVDLDLLATALYRRPKEGVRTRWRDNVSLLGTARGVLRWRITHGFGVFAGPAVHLLASESMQPGRFAAVEPHQIRERDDDGARFDPNVWVWPGFEAGLRVHL